MDIAKGSSKLGIGDGLSAIFGTPSRAGLFQSEKLSLLKPIY
jgi:hypothetical protein